MKVKVEEEEGTFVEDEIANSSDSSGEKHETTEIEKQPAGGVYESEDEEDIRVARHSTASLGTGWTILVGTVGWEAIGSKIQKRFDDLMWSEDQGVSKRLSFMSSLPAPDIWLDCRAFHDPQQRNYGLAWHIGEHLEILRRASKHRELPNILVELKRAVAEKERASAKTKVLSLMFVCKSGTHRAVALARIVSEILKLERHNVKKPVHWSSGSWNNNGKCFACANCDLDNPAKPALFDACHRFYKAI